ncbi:hypothetical protein TNCV_527161 [Trichonephila clavipes]|nr:hypothetical protein TNCV_527161 [Trichonephila clavipes]
MSAGTGEYFPPLQFTCRICGGGDKGRVAIYRPFGELRRAKIVLSPVWCSRPTTGVPLAHATMNFVGLDLTASISEHGSLVVMVTDTYVLILVPLKSQRVEGLMHVKSVEVENPAVGVMGKFGERESAQFSFSSLDHS